MRKSIEEDNKASYWQSRARGSERTAEGVHDVAFCQRRIDEAMAEIRKIDRYLGSGEIKGIHLANYQARRQQEQAKASYYQEQYIALGGAKYSKATIQKGDKLLYRGKWYPVIRANAKTVTVGNWLDVESFTWKVPYAEIKGHRKASELE